MDYVAAILDKLGFKKSTEAAADASTIQSSLKDF